MSSWPLFALHLKLFKMFFGLFYWQRTLKGSGGHTTEDFRSRNPQQKLFFSKPFEHNNISFIFYTQVPCWSPLKNLRNFTHPHKSLPILPLEPSNEKGFKQNLFRKPTTFKCIKSWGFFSKRVPRRTPVENQQPLTVRIPFKNHLLLLIMPIEPYKGKVPFFRVLQVEPPLESEPHSTIQKTLKEHFFFKSVRGTLHKKEFHVM